MSMSKILVTAKVNPDLDGTSCTLAYADFLKQTGKDAEGLISGAPQSEVKYFIEKHNVSIPTRLDEISDMWGEFSLYTSGVSRHKRVSRYKKCK